ncbi:GNAT family N-acetyltransferase [Streptomyces rapamycinicus]|uniref:N-acetyltransferase domain-containing protein n=2 Tax=Streptomyces rapamycinicus TaxID=1226757 RepID=A0A0A0NX01_STRRN|nr:GNAT family N-acetyltransferase [Streptomyces rapamycinicus]AGP60670.1 hypothetical protein M271_46535 [Streptomyces rapamycinicus NRRL 5491]MBB4788165.1 GNAT superfamily N-acetyltransferase [Streptomyces rapamycinicus]RLV72500.1 hypothetical protein D3C57_148275 [Streptomyces rapamycinicus NRRL 5491]UTP36216.1 GNAT family N-acetyltransferase [Streptomyces rapamycinicus NRRL 5491]
MQSTTFPPRTADLFTQGLENRPGSALLRFGAARRRSADRLSCRWTPDEPPAHPGEERVVELGEHHHEELLAFLREHSPGHSTGPGSAGISLWAGIRDENGRLVACGALSSLRDSGAPLMASVATDARLRGQGLGAALASFLTRYAVRRYGFCTLWQLADNAPAERLYTRLGYRDEDLCVAARIAAR